MGNGLEDSNIRRSDDGGRASTSGEHAYYRVTSQISQDGRLLPQKSLDATTILSYWLGSVRYRLSRPWPAV